MARKKKSPFHISSSHTKSGKIDNRVKNLDNAKYFISTVCFGQNSLETEIFQNWRHDHLVKKYWGKKFVSCLTTINLPDVLFQ